LPKKPGAVTKVVRFAEKVDFAIIQNTAKKNQEHIFRHQCKVVWYFFATSFAIFFIIFTLATFQQMQFCPPNFSRGATIAASIGTEV
jgi:hypothetical protein